MNYQIKDFVDMQLVVVEPLKFKDGALVVVRQSAGGMNFQHSMRPEQARYMAAALQMAADEAEVLK